MNKHKQHFWGYSVSFFGAWESLSFATRGKVPTVSRTVWKTLGWRTKPFTKLMVAVYLLGMGRHLLNNKNFN